MDTELAALVKTVGPADGEEWEERCTRWNQFTEIENKVRIVAVPKSVDDVVAIAKWAAKYKQSNISVRAGGHGFFSAAEVVVDMREGFGYTSVDESGIATIGMGQTLGELDEATSPWHVPVGVVSHTGTGLLLTGGVGYQSKLRGASADNILEVTIITSDGQIHTCSKDEEADLFFAVRGAAPNVGIVTEVKTRCFQLPTVLGTLRVWPLTVENLKRLVEWADQDEVLDDNTITPYIGLIPSPDNDPLCCIHVVCIGTADNDDKYNALIDQLKGTGDLPLLETGRVPFKVPQTIFDAAFARGHWYVSQAYIPGQNTIPLKAIEDIVETYTNLPMEKLAASIVLEQRGNVDAGYHQFASTSCAQPRYGQRWEIYTFVKQTGAENLEDVRKHGRDIKNTLSKHCESGGRVHFTRDEPGQIEYYYGENSARLREVVAKYDPIRLFATCNGMEF